MILWNRLSLKSKNPQTRRNAVDRLVASNTTEAVELLVACLCDKDAMVRRTAAAAFNTITDERAINSLISALNDTNCDVRAAAAGALGRQGDLRCIAPLVGALRDCKSRVRTRAAASLRKLGWKAANKEEHALFEVALGNPGAAVRAGHAAIELLASELSSNTSFFRRLVAEALEEVNDPRATKSLLTAARSDTDVTVRVAAIYALSGMKDKQAIPILEEGLRSHDSHVRLAAVQVLTHLADSTHTHRFLELLKDNHFEVRLAAVNFLSKLRDPKIEEALVPMLWDPDHDVREVVAKALGSMHSTAATESLIVALTDEEYAVRVAAEQALKQIDEQWIFSEAAQRAKTRLELSAHDNRSWVRSATVMLLKKLNTAKSGVYAPAGTSQKNPLPEVTWTEPQPRASSQFAFDAANPENP
jgi:HEAT repeat protein